MGGTYRALLDLSSLNYQLYLPDQVLGESHDVLHLRLMEAKANSPGMTAPVLHRQGRKDLPKIQGLEGLAPANAELHQIRH